MNSDTYSKIVAKYALDGVLDGISGYNERDNYGFEPAERPDECRDAYDAGYAVGVAIRAEAGGLSDLTHQAMVRGRNLLPLGSKP